MTTASFLAEIRGSAKDADFYLNPPKSSLWQWPGRPSTSAFLNGSEWKRNRGWVWRPGDAARTSVISARSRSLFSLRLHSLHSSGRYSLWLQAGRRGGGREGGRNRTPLSLPLRLSHRFSKLGFKAPAKLSLRHRNARLAQQLCQLEKKWRRARRSREPHSIFLPFLSRNFAPNRHFGVGTQYRRGKSARAVAEKVKYQ